MDTATTEDQAKAIAAKLTPEQRCILRGATDSAGVSQSQADRLPGNLTEGFTRDWRWRYRATAFGRAVAEALRAS